MIKGTFCCDASDIENIIMYVIIKSRYVNLYILDLNDIWQCVSLLCSYISHSPPFGSVLSMVFSIHLIFASMKGLIYWDLTPTIIPNGFNGKNWGEMSKKLVLGIMLPIYKCLVWRQALDPGSMCQSDDFWVVHISIWFCCHYFLVFLYVRWSDCYDFEQHDQTLSAIIIPLYPPC